MKMEKAETNIICHQTMDDELGTAFEGFMTLNRVRPLFLENNLNNLLQIGLFLLSTLKLKLQKIYILNILKILEECGQRKGGNR